jgi:hypothetical protein
MVKRAPRKTKNAYISEVGKLQPSERASVFVLLKIMYVYAKAGKERA